MDTLVRYAIYALLVAAVIGAVCKAWDDTVGAHYRAQQLAKDQPVIDHFKNELDLAQRENKRLSGDVDDLRDRYNALFAEGKQRQAASDARVAALAAAARGAENALANERATVARQPSPAPVGATACAAAYDELGKAIEDDK